MKFWTSLAAWASSRKSWFLFVLGKFADKHIRGSVSAGATGNSTLRVWLLLLLK